MASEDSYDDDFDSGTEVKNTGTSLMPIIEVPSEAGSESARTESTLQPK
jgi:hypothetical protein